MHTEQIVVFDGVCNLCSYAVQFIIKRDKHAVFTFTSMQSGYGKNLLSKYAINPEEVDTLVLVKSGQLYFKSDAAIEIAKGFEGVWKVLSLCQFIPRPIRDAVYSLIARNRYKMFGQKDACMLPTNEIKERFL